MRKSLGNNKHLEEKITQYLMLSQKKARISYWMTTFQSVFWIAHLNNLQYFLGFSSHHLFMNPKYLFLAHLIFELQMWIFNCLLKISQVVKMEPSNSSSLLKFPLRYLSQNLKKIWSKTTNHIGCMFTKIGSYL